jgi:hypothetical protein
MNDYDIDFNLLGDQENSSPPWKDVSVLNKENIQLFLSKLFVYSEAKYFLNHAEVHVRPNVGTSLYYAEGETGIKWLEKNSYKIDRKPQVSVYHLRFGEAAKSI